MYTTIRKQSKVNLGGHHKHTLHGQGDLLIQIHH
jgi:hypothetical protein